MHKFIVNDEKDPTIIFFTDVEHLCLGTGYPDVCSEADGDLPKVPSARHLQIMLPGLHGGRASGIRQTTSESLS